ncbi:MAG: BrnT family toxin [Proteobacteria bacterium]|nr:BrnT family toxin [Pseudomonadota bacterium]
MKFLWDPVKNKINQAKHGVSFENAVLVFDDPYHLSMVDRIVDGEERWLTIGQIWGMVVLILAHTYKEEGGQEIVRIISARKATKKERKGYEYGEKYE